MLPGDSLIEKIFEEGIKDAAAVIVVLSSFSVSKPWVREELNAAMVKRINHGSKLIPVVIDDCQVPAVLQATLWERISDMNSYGSSLDRILASIFRLSERPQIGSPPSYVTSVASTIGELNRVDSLVLRISCEVALRGGSEWVNPGKIFLEGGTEVIPEGELADALEILAQEGYIELFRTMSAKVSKYKVTTYGFEAYAAECIPDYDAKLRAVVATIVNKQLSDNVSIASDIGEAQFLIDHILDVLESGGHITQAKMNEGISRVYSVSPSLRRWLANN